MSDGAAPHLAIVGGGTAGWLAALMLQRASGSGPAAPRAFPGVSPRTGTSFPSGNALKISVIESPNIPTVGVGEGSTSIFRQVLLDLGLDEAEFLAKTGATLKFGIKHAGWRRDGKDYFGPIDDPSALVPAPQGLPGVWLQHAQIAGGKRISDQHLFTRLMRGRTSAYARKGGRMVPLSPYHHAYHFDQARLGRYLARKATGIDHVRTEVEGLDRDPETGRITALRCTDNQTIPVDFVVDCTGFSRAIIGQMGGGWVSYGDMLPLNKALPFWLDHAEDTDIAPYTLAQAMGAGWMWGIPVQDRMGCGYVYSDAHLTEDAAVAELEAHLRQPVEIRRVIDIAPGRLDLAWVSNCVALGLAQSFLEPLEATSIHGTLVQVMLLTQSGTPALLTATDGTRAGYNALVAGQVDDFAQFINMHYAGGRRDTAFWRDMTEGGIAAPVRARLQMWQDTPLTSIHLPSLPGGLPHMDPQLQLPVLDGLGLLPKAPSKQIFNAAPRQRAEARKTLDRLSAEFKSAAAKALGHRDYLEAVA